MSIRISGSAMGELHTLFRWGAMGTWTDSQLMTQFLSGREESEAAFRVLIHRHGPMVLGVCRRVLGDEHAAEDAFQSTFLVLVKKAGTLRNRDLLTNWLYGVALRVASKERSRGARRRFVERQAAEIPTTVEGETDQAEIRSVIDEEIRKLPERYRVPLVLCHVEGLRHDEVAQRLGCPVGTLESRLSRAREQLRSRLARRGLAPSAASLGAALILPKSGLLLPSLIEATVKAAMEYSIDPGRIAKSVISWISLRIASRATWLSSGPGAKAAALLTLAGIVTIGLRILQADNGMPTPYPSTGKLAEHTTIASISPAAVQRKAYVSTRSAFAVARPMSGITIDGGLEDWPKDLETYPIQHQVLGSKNLDGKTNYAAEPRDLVLHPEAYFKVGYDQNAGCIYLAVVVHDNHTTVHPTSFNGPNANIFMTDAVEVYIDGMFSGRNKPEEQSLDASTMPVLQYVGVPGEAPAYGDRWGANPSLLYSNVQEKRTRMRYRCEGDVTTYEWAIQAYDRYPGKLTKLAAGTRIGFDLAVVDKDSVSAPPAWMYWGPSYRGFKGWDAANLGELLLAEGPEHTTAR